MGDIENPESDLELSAGEGEDFEDTDVEVSEPTVIDSDAAGPLREEDKAGSPDAIALEDSSSDAVALEDSSSDVIETEDSGESGLSFLGGDYGEDEVSGNQTRILDTTPVEGLVEDSSWGDAAEEKSGDDEDWAVFSPLEPGEVSVSGVWPELERTHGDEEEEEVGAPLSELETPEPEHPPALIVELEEPASEEARLVCVQGGEVGREFSVSGGITWVGRSVSNEVIIEHPSVSRVHAVIQFKNGGFHVTDKESNNGVLLNGARVSESPLNIGDQIAFGDIVFRFAGAEESSWDGDLIESVEVDPVSESMPAPPLMPAPRSGRRRSYSWSFALSGTVLLVTVGVVAWIVMSRFSPTEFSVQSDEVFQAYLSGVEAFKRHRWAEAERLLVVSSRAAPEHRRTTEYLEAIVVERRAEELLKLAQKSREEGDLLRAYTHANQVGDSLYFSADAEELVHTIDVELDARVARAKTSIKAGLFDEALKLLADVEEVRPGRPEVAALRDMAKQAQTPTPREAAPKARTPAPKKIAPVVTPPVEKPTGEWARAQEIFERGNMNEALSILKADSASYNSREMVAALGQFKATYESGLEAHRAKRVTLGIGLLERALELEGMLSEGRSIYATNIRKRLGDLYYVQGQQAFSTHDWELAFQGFSNAMRHVPGYGLAQRGLDGLAEKAGEFYRAGEAAWNSDPATAQAHWRRVLKMVKPSDPHYLQASRRLRDGP
ncbi:MAG: FHA domain-containing protein [Myxococcota bacterium]|nr:FHA domain-containing protein [Myxococcota bacterium]